MTKFGRLIGNSPFHKVPSRHYEHNPITIQSREELRRARIKALREQAAKHHNIASAKGKT